ncbi:MAG: dephospho-CoA kinase [Clostridia bacterium]|nr:dephospho-CoA kinase [Clostridia bacterium]
MKPNKPYVIGLTGGIACGKSTVARYLRTLGVPVLDADAISHELTAEGGEALPQIRAVFGDEVFNGEVLNRRALGQAVFGHPEALEKLNAILHPLVIGRMQRQTGESAAAVLVWDVPLLFETGMDRLCDETWCVTVRRGTQIRRIHRRDHLPAAEAEARIDAQMPLDEKAKRADHVIQNDRPLGETQKRARRLLRAAERSMRHE